MPTYSGRLLFALKVALFASAVCAAPQDAAKPEVHPEIRGVVLEPGTTMPVWDAEVTLEYYGPKQPQLMPSPPKSSTSVRTDPSGAFTFHPAQIGYFYIRVKKAGYSEMSGMPPAASSAQSVTLSAAQPVKEVRLSLSRPGQIAGRVIAADTRKPIANVRLQALSVRKAGQMSLPTGKIAVSQENGEFVISELAAGDYVIEIMPRRGREERVISKFSDADLKIVEQDFGHTYWPGGLGPADVLPVTLAAGATLDIGALPIEKTGWYRVHVRFPGVNCNPGDKIAVREVQRILSMEQHVSLATLPCREDLLVAGFPPGAYRLMFGLNRAQADPEFASVPLVIDDENQEITVSFELPVTVDGVFVAAEGSRLPDLSTAGVLWESGGGKPSVGIGPIKPEAAGKFQIPTFLSEGRRLRILGIGASAYVKEIRYNGSPVKGDFVPLDRRAVTQSLTIVLDDKPAAITGSVMKGDQPVGQAVVMVVKWPLPEGPVMPGDFLYARADDKGKFQLGGLAPGEYRVVAARIATMMEGPALDTIRRALAASPKIELGARAFQNLTLEVSDLR